MTDRAFVLVAALAAALPLTAGVAQAPSRYLYVWAGPVDSAPSAHAAHGGGAKHGCAVPVVVGKYWVMPIAEQHRVVVLDVSRPARARIVSSLPTDSTFFPHWSAADPRSDRIVVTEQGDGVPRVAIARLDARTGRLRWDERFGDANATKPGIDFSRIVLPGGSRGSAMPHAAVFVPER